MNDTSLQTDEELRAHLHGETSKLPWSELEKFFARGILFKVAKGLDIIDVAIVMTRDDKDTLQKWVDDGSVAAVKAENAKQWNETSSILWAVVVAPFALVQEVTQKLDS